MNEDLALLERLKRQDQRGLEEAIHKYAGYVSAVVRKTLGPNGSKEDAEELISDVFVALWQNAGSLRGNSSLKPWLAVVARNAALTRLRRPRLEEDLEDDQLPAEEDGPEDLAEREEHCRLVRQAVDRMEPIDREIFLRHYFWYQKVAWIAGEMKISESMVKTRLKRGREKLKKALMKEERTP